MTVLWIRQQAIWCVRGGKFFYLFFLHNILSSHVEARGIDPASLQTAASLRVIGPRRYLRFNNYARRLIMNISRILPYTRWGWGEVCPSALWFAIGAYEECSCKMHSRIHFHKFYDANLFLVDLACVCFSLFLVVAPIFFYIIIIIILYHIYCKLSFRQKK